MLIALIDNVRFEAKKGLHGICPGCLQPVIAKCGEIKIHHWAHRSKGTCACWWEPETDWHRTWKKYFPVEWQEVYISDPQNMEKHVADIKTSHGFVIEFQHSYINSEKRIAREKFYHDMVWVVDGTRTDSDYFRFFLGNDLRSNRTVHPGIYNITSPRKYFSQLWISSPVPVIFDFLGGHVLSKTEPNRNILWCLFPDRIEGKAIIAALRREDFINIAATNSQLLKSAHNFINYVEQIRVIQIQAQKDEVKRRQEQQRKMRYGRHFRF